MQSLLREQKMATQEIQRAYRQGTTWSGCDWPTKVGKAGLNLNGLKASHALLLARATSGTERADWQTAVEWLTGVEEDVRNAEGEAQQAVVLALDDRLEEALAHVQRACAIEARYHNQLVWQPLRDAIEAAIRSAGP